MVGEIKKLHEFGGMNIIAVVIGPKRRFDSAIQNTFRMQVRLPSGYVPKHLEYITCKKFAPEYFLQKAALEERFLNSNFD